MLEDFENNNYEPNGNANNHSNGVSGSHKEVIKNITLRALPPLPRGGGAGGGAVAGVAENGVYENQHQTSIDSNNNDCDNNNSKDVNGLEQGDGGGSGELEDEDQLADGRLNFASNFEKIKQYGWYWGPISSLAAEKILSNEPDGSFIVRDSSDDHYIFSLTFKLNNCVRHVRIEQDKGKFSFGSFAKFKSRTIVEFIEKAVEHSRSGRYLFFLHRRPEHGPMRVQLKNPVSRFKHIQSLQHMCR